MMRFFLLLFLAPLLVSAEVKITPDKPPVVPAGGTVHLTASVPVNWSLAPGSGGKIDGDGTYHAPADVPVKNTLAGCQVLGNDHIFNTRIDSLPVDANSVEWMALIPPNRLGYYPGWGINFGDSKTPKQKMHFAYTPQNDGSFEMVPWPELKREGGIFLDPQSGIDRHQVTIDRETCDIYELYGPYEPGNNPKCPTCNAQSGLKYNSMTPNLPTGGVDAASLLITPLTLGLEEIRTGVVQHALRMTLKNNIIAPRPIWPARTNAGAWGKIPYGTRFRLKANFDTSQFSQYAQVLLTQLKQYGLILADGGGNFDVSTYTDLTEDPVVEGALGELWAKGPKSSDFEIIDESQLMAAADRGSVKEGTPLTTADGYASVIATSKSNSSDVGRARIVLGGVTVGVPKPAEWIQSGVATQFQSWVNGTTNKGVVWSMNPPLGKLSPDGHYTAPDVAKPTGTLLTVASAAAPKSSVKVALTVLPKGAIRIAVGNATRAPGAPNKSAPDYGPDSNGNMWWRGQGGEVSWGVVYDDFQNSAWANKKDKDIQLFYTSRYSLGDMVYSFRVPNGRYKITLMFAQPQCKDKFPKEWRIPFHLETQGKLVVPDFDMGAGIDDACTTPVTESIPAEVTDNDLYFALRRVTHGKSTPSPLLNAFSIEPDTSAPHLSVAPERVSSLTLGQEIQFKTIGWQMQNAARWSVVKGPGTVTPAGLFTAPKTPPSGEQTIVLKATSTTNPSQSAMAQMVFKFGDFALTAADTTVAKSLSTQLTPSVSGAKYDNVAWSLKPNIGKVQPDGTYVAPDDLASDTNVTVTAQSKDVPGQSASVTLNLKSKPEPLRINSGGGAFKDAKGNSWLADTGFSPALTYHNNVPIAGASADMQQLYQSARYAYSNQNFGYKFRLPNGRYAVTLKFADYTYKEAGHYNFDVVINGATVLKNFDFDTVNGPRAAADKRFETVVKDKVLSIDFLGHQGGASVGGIEIVPLGG